MNKKLCNTCTNDEGIATEILVSKFLMVMEIMMKCCLGSCFNGTLRYYNMWQNSVMVILSTQAHTDLASTSADTC